MEKIKVKKIVKVQKDKLYKLPFYVVDEFKNGAAIIMNAGKYGALREDGVIIVEPKYEGFTRDFEDGIAIFQNEPGNLYKYEAINKKGEVIKRTNLKFGPFLDNSFAVIYDESEQGLIDRYGNYIMKPQDKYILLGLYKDLAIMAKYNNHSKKYIIDKSGNMYKFFGYNCVEIVGENLIHVEKNGTHFLTDAHNNKISRTYDNFTHYGDRLIATLGNKKYVIDSLGNEKKCYDMSSDDDAREMFKYMDDVKEEKDDSLNIYTPTDYKSLIEGVIENCVSSDYKTPHINVGNRNVIIDCMYACGASNLKFKYMLTIYKYYGKITIKEFDNKDDCDKYYDELMKEIDKCNINTQNQIDKVYKDANDSLDMFLDKLKVKK